MIIVTMRHLVNQDINIATANRIDSAETRFDWDQRKRGLKNDPRQSHSADGGPEECWILIGTNFMDRSVGQHQGQATNMISETALNMMILTVNIGSDRSTNRHETSSRCDRNKETLRDNHFQ